MNVAIPTAGELRKKLKAHGNMAMCPAHDNKNTPALSISGADNGKPLFHCHGGCTQTNVIDALRAKGIWPEPEKKGLTVAELAAEKGLPEQVMRESGFADDTSNGQDVVRIQYEGANGEILCTRYRASGKRFWFRKGDKQQPFGLWRLKKSEDVILVEGETDSIALWAAGFNAIGVPGAGAWKESFAVYLEGCPNILVHVEPDNGGQEFRAKLEKSRLAPRMRFFTVTGAKDPCELRAKNIDGFRQAMEGALSTATRSAHAISAETDNPVSAALAGIRSAALITTGVLAPVKYLTHERIPCGLVLLAGRPKCRKSWLALQAAKAGAEGGKLLGQPTRQGHTLGLFLEDNERRMAGRLAFLGAHNMTAEALERMHVVYSWPKGDLGIEALRQWMTLHPDTVLIVIDVLQKFRDDADSRASAYKLDYDALSGLQKLARDYPDLCILILHHTRKAEADSPGDRVSGTHGITGRGRLHHPGHRL